MMGLNELWYEPITWFEWNRLARLYYKITLTSLISELLTGIKFTFRRHFEAGKSLSVSKPSAKKIQGSTIKFLKYLVTSHQSAK